MTRKLLVVLSVLTIMVFFIGITARAEEPAGKKVFLDSKCNICHAVSAEGITKKTGTSDKGPPDLSGVGLKHKADWITKFLQKQETLNGKNHPKAFTGKEEDLKALVAWLESLKSEKKNP